MKGKDSLNPTVWKWVHVSKLPEQTHVPEIPFILIERVIELWGLSGNWSVIPDALTPQTYVQ